MKWERRFLSMAELVSSWSKDPSTKVGAVIADPFNRVVSVGYNGPPRRTHDDVVADRDRKLRRTIHAEKNAILFARRDLFGCSLFVTHHPCAQCASLIAQAGIARVFHLPTPDQFAVRWRDDMMEAQEIFDECGILLRVLNTSVDTDGIIKSD